MKNKLKMKKKGFSLLELLAVIIILGIIFTIVLVVNINVKENVRIKYYRTQENMIIISAKDYYTNHQNELPKKVGSHNEGLKLKTLIEKEYLKPVLNIDKKQCDMEKSVVVVKKISEKEFHYYVSLYCDNYEPTDVQPEIPTFWADIPNTKWTNQNVKIVISYGPTSNDQYYRVGKNLEWLPYHGAFIVSGNQKIYAKGVSKGGRESLIGSYEVTNIDKKPPRFEGLSTVKIEVGQNYDLKKGVTAVDEESGIKETFSFDPITTVELLEGNRPVYYKVSDKAGNVIEVPRTIIVKPKTKPEDIKWKHINTFLETNSFIVTEETDYQFTVIGRGGDGGNGTVNCGSGVYNAGAASGTTGAVAIHKLHLTVGTQVNVVIDESGSKLLINGETVIAERGGNGGNSSGNTAGLPDTRIPIATGGNVANYNGVIGNAGDVGYTDRDADYSECYLDSGSKRRWKVKYYEGGNGGSSNTINANIKFFTAPAAKGGIGGTGETSYTTSCSANVCWYASGENGKDGGNAASKNGDNYVFGNAGGGGGGCGSAVSVSHCGYYATFTAKGGQGGQGAVVVESQTTTPDIVWEYLGHYTASQNVTLTPGTYQFYIIGHGGDGGNGGTHCSAKKYKAGGAAGTSGAIASYKATFTTTTIIPITFTGSSTQIVVEGKTVIAQNGGRGGDANGTVPGAPNNIIPTASGGNVFNYSGKEGNVGEKGFESSGMGTSCCNSCTTNFWSLVGGNGGSTKISSILVKYFPGVPIYGGYGGEEDYLSGSDNAECNYGEDGENGQTGLTHENGNLIFGGAGTGGGGCGSATSSSREDKYFSCANCQGLGGKGASGAVVIDKAK